MTRRRRYRPDPVGAAGRWAVYLATAAALIVVPTLAAVAGAYILLNWWDGTGAHP